MITINDHRKIFDIPAKPDRSILQFDRLLQLINKQDIRSIRTKDIRHTADALFAVYEFLKVVDHTLFTRSGIVSAAAVYNDRHQFVRSRIIYSLEIFQMPGQLFDRPRLFTDHTIPDKLRGLPFIAHEHIHTGIQLVCNLGHLT